MWKSKWNLNYYFPSLLFSFSYVKIWLFILRWAKLAAGVFSRENIPVYLFKTTTPTPFIPFAIRQVWYIFIFWVKKFSWTFKTTDPLMARHFLEVPTVQSNKLRLFLANTFPLSRCTLLKSLSMTRFGLRIVPITSPTPMIIGLCGLIMVGRGGNYGQHHTWNKLSHNFFSICFT